MYETRNYRELSDMVWELAKRAKQYWNEGERIPSEGRTKEVQELIDWCDEMTGMVKRIEDRMPMLRRELGNPLGFAKWAMAEKLCRIADWLVK